VEWSGVEWSGVEWPTGLRVGAGKGSDLPPQPPDPIQQIWLDLDNLSTIAPDLTIARGQFWFLSSFLISLNSNSEIHRRELTRKN
jgi:hypothetical protein